MYYSKSELLIKANGQTIIHVGTNICQVGIIPFTQKVLGSTNSYLINTYGFGQE